MAKTIPWVRTIVIILSMLIGQLPWMSAAASAPVEAPAPAIDLAPVAPVEPTRLAAAPAPGVAELPPRQVRLPGECKIKVLAAAVEDDVDPPDHTSPPDGTNNKTPFGATAITEAGDRTELLIWFVIMNWTGMDDPECATPEAVTINSVMVQVGDVAPTVFLSLPATLNGPRDYIAATFTYGISSFTPSPITIRMDVSGTDAGGNPVQDKDDSWSVTLSSPGFEIVSFTPSVTEAVPGDLVDFTLRVRNTRAGVDIDSLAFQSLDPAYQSQCNDIGDWTGPGGGLLVTPITQGGVAECIIHNVSMPPDTETGEYRLTGTITAGSGGADPTEAEVESDPPVVLHLASIRVTKRVVQILRGTEVVSPPAQPGDRITYEITVENTSQGGVAVDTITIQDSLTGRVPGTQGVTLAAGESKTFPIVAWTVLPNSQDPLTNIASVTARAVNTGRT
ncbi:MAG TPA: hypothetical protein PKD46_05640, partial [Aggregatilineaceae bacterium]|nr:hypothetical protein [Aggregatilineaceae bacterium]